jgi:hypothetical protein
MEEKRLLRILVLALILCQACLAGEKGTLPNVPSIAKEAANRTEKTANGTLFKNFEKVYKRRVKEAEKLVNGTGNGTMQEKFNDIISTYFSREFQQKIESAGKQILEWSNGTKRYAGQFLEAQKSVNAASAGRYYLLVFISKSMDSELGIYFSDMETLLKKQGDNPSVIPIAVLRGAVNDARGRPSLKATVLWLRNKMQKYGVQVWIDPLLYREYGIDRVPCLLLTSYQPAGELGKTCSGEAYLGCGYSVFGFLSEVEKKTKDRALKELLRKLD